MSDLLFSLLLLRTLYGPLYPMRTIDVIVIRNRAPNLQTYDIYPQRNRKTPKPIAHPNPRCKVWFA